MNNFRPSVRDVRSEPKLQAENDEVKMRGVSLCVFKLPDGCAIGGFAAQSLEKSIQMRLALRGSWIIFRISQRDEQSVPHLIFVNAGDFPTQSAARSSTESSNRSAFRWGMVRAWDFYERLELTGSGVCR